MRSWSRSPSLQLGASSSHDFVVAEFWFLAGIEFSATFLQHFNEFLTYLLLDLERRRFPIEFVIGHATPAIPPYCFTRSMYSPVAVAMRTMSPSLTKAGTWISAPPSTVAALVMLLDVLPRTAGSV